MVYFWGMFGSLLARNIVSWTASNISVNPFSLRDWESYLQFFGAKFATTFMGWNCRNSYILEHSNRLVPGQRSADEYGASKIFFRMSIGLLHRQVYRKSDFEIHRKITGFLVYTSKYLAALNFSLVYQYQASVVGCGRIFFRNSRLFLTQKSLGHWVSIELGRYLSMLPAMLNNVSIAAASQQQ